MGIRVSLRRRYLRFHVGLFHFPVVRLNMNPVVCAGLELLMIQMKCIESIDFVFPGLLHLMQDAHFFIDSGTTIFSTFGPAFRIPLILVYTI